MRLQVEHLSKSYGGVPVLRDVCFTAEPGITCITAPSGGGKTTLLRLLLGLERADSGRISGLEGLRASAVFQEDRLLEHWNAAENLRFVHPGGGESPERLLAALGLEEGAEKAVRDFSGGMRRRVALARALWAPFDFLALDEPFTGLDAENLRRAARCIRERTAGKLVVLACHNDALVAELADQVVTLPRRETETGPRDRQGGI